MVKTFKSNAVVDILAFRCLFGKARCGLTNQLQATNTIQSDTCHFQNRVELARQLIC